MKKTAVVLAVLLALAGAMAAWGVRLDVDPSQLEPIYATGHSRFMELRGMRVHYRDQGDGEPVLLLHGVGSSLQTWDGWAQVLSPHYRVISLDLPGFGLTGPDPKGDYSIDAYCGLLCEFLANLQIDRCNLAGNSLGGRIAWGYTWRHPGQVRKLILVDAAGYPLDTPPAPIAMARMPVLAGLARWFTPRAAVEKSVKSVYGDPSKVTDAQVDRYHQMLLRDGNRETIARMAELDYFSQTANLHRINQPVLILWGQKDSWIPVDHAARFKKDLPHAQVIIYPDAGHVPMEEIPMVTARDALAFLQK